MVCDRSLQRTECPIMKKGRSYLQVTQRRGAESISQRGIPFGLLKAEIFVLTWAIENHIACAEAKHRRDVGATNAVGLEVAEHLIRLTSNRMTGHAVRLSEEK